MTRTSLRDTYCLAKHAGGYGDCIAEPNHTGRHRDAFGHTYTDEDNERIVTRRRQLRQAAVAGDISIPVTADELRGGDVVLDGDGTRLYVVKSAHRPSRSAEVRITARQGGRLETFTADRYSTFRVERPGHYRRP